MYALSEEQYWHLYGLLAEGPPAKDYPPAGLAHGKGGPDQMYMWNRMIERHAPKAWPAAVAIYKKSCAKHGVDPFGHTSNLPQVKGTKAPTMAPAAAAAPPPPATAQPVDIGFDWLKTGEGQKALQTLFHDMMKEIQKQSPGTRVGAKEVRQAIAKYMAA